MYLNIYVYIYMCVYVKYIFKYICFRVCVCVCITTISENKLKKSRIHHIQLKLAVLYVVVDISVSIGGRWAQDHPTLPSDPTPIFFTISFLLLIWVSSFFFFWGFCKVEAWIIYLRVFFFSNRNIQHCKFLFVSALATSYKFILYFFHF